MFTECLSATSDARGAGPRLYIATSRTVEHYLYGISIVSLTKVSTSISYILSMSIYILCKYLYLYNVAAPGAPIELLDV
jgi:hypothetical protein